MLESEDLNGVRFRPGAFYACPRSGSSDPASAVTDWATITTPTTGELATTPGLMGVQIRYGWTELEPTEGGYVYTDIQGHLDDMLAARPNDPPLLSILIQCKTFVSTQHVVPSWMRTDAYGGGEISYSETDGGASDGYIIRFNNSAVRAKFALLAAALGRQFANNVRIELIGITEMNIPGIATGGTLTVAEAMAGHLDGGLICLQSLQTAFPRTIIRQILNYPRPEIEALMPSYIAAGIAIGAADVFQDESGYWRTSGYDGIYDHMQDYGGIVPTIHEFQRKNWFFSNFQRRIYPATGWSDSVDNVSSAGSGLTLISSSTVDHGLDHTDTTQYLDIEPSTNAVLRILTAAGGWSVGNLVIDSVPTAKNIIVRITYTSQTAPTGMQDATTPAYPLSGRTYVPNARTVNGYVPTMDNLVDFVRTEFPSCNYFIFTRMTETSVLTDETQNFRFRKFVNNTLAKHGKSCGCSTVRPTSIA